MGPCFWFGLKMVLIIQSYFCYCCFRYESECRVKAFSASHPTSAASRLGKLGELFHRDIPEHMGPWPAHGAGRKGGRGENTVLWDLSPQVTTVHNGALLSWRWLNNSLARGSESKFLGLFCLCVQLLVLLSLSQPMSFYTSVSLSHPTGAGECDVWDVTASWG